MTVRIYVDAENLQDGTYTWETGGGTADAITATYSPALTTLVDGQMCFVRAKAANGTTTPTFSPNGITAHTITKDGGSALSPGDISGAGHELILRYNLANTRWELLNPATTPQFASSRFSTLALCDAAAASASAEFVINGDVSLTGDFTSTAPAVRFDGGTITTGSYTADLSATVVSAPQATLFDVSGGGLVKFAKGQHIQDAWFGVAPDGSSDDAPALATLYTQLASSPGCTVHHRSGVRYRLESTKIRIPSNTRVAGNGAIFEMRNGYFNRGILIDGATDVRVSDLSVEMKATTATAQYYGIAIQNSSRVHLLRCKASDPSWSDSTDTASVAVLMYGFLCGQSTTESLASGTYAGDGSDDLACDDITLEDCLAEGCYQYGFEDFPKVVSYRHKFIRCIARNIGNANGEEDAPAGFKPGQNVYDCQVIDPVCVNCWYGIIPINYCSVYVENPTVRNPRRTGIAVTLAEHSYYSLTTGGDAGTGYFEGDGTGPYTLERLHVSGGAIFHTSDDLTGSSNAKSAVLINGSITRNGRILFDGLDIDVTTGWDGYITDSGMTAAIPNVEIRGGRCKARLPALLTNAGTGSPVLAAPRVHHVVFETNDATVGNRYCQILGTAADVHHCTFRGMTTWGLWMKGAGSMAHDNTFIGLNAGSVATTSAIIFADDANTYYAWNNVVVGGTVSGIIEASGSSISIKQWGNSADSAIPVFTSSNANGVDGPMLALGGGGNGSRVFFGTAVPTTGAYKQGDIIINHNASTGSATFWVCVSSGTPGTWEKIVSAPV
jgi:hypothetical protein